MMRQRSSGCPLVGFARRQQHWPPASQLERLQERLGNSLTTD